jgi:hypothetical protein
MNILRFIPRFSGLPAMAALPILDGSGRKEKYILSVSCTLCGGNLQGVDGFGALARTSGAATEDRSALTVLAKCLASYDNSGL